MPAINRLLLVLLLLAPLTPAAPDPAAAGPSLLPPTCFFFCVVWGNERMDGSHGERAWQTSWRDV